MLKKSMLENVENLIEKATEVRLNAHAPYSNFLVGSAVLDDKGDVHVGCNVENSAYPSGSCAEEQAIGAMCAKGGKTIQDIVVIGKSDALVTPCGACRQRIREFSAPQTRIHVCDTEKGLLKSYSMQDLLPDSFGPENL